MLNGLTEGTGRGMVKPILGPDSHLGGLGAKDQGLTEPSHPVRASPSSGQAPRIRAFSSWDSAGMWWGSGSP